MIAKQCKLFSSSVHVSVLSFHDSLHVDSVIRIILNNYVFMPKKENLKRFIYILRLH